MIEALNTLLADYQVFYQKLRGYHWNVKGPLFFGLHAKFEEMYLAAAEHVDGLAERISALGGQPLSTLQQQLAAARLSEDGSQPDANSMVANVVSDLGQLNGWLREVQARAEDDSATANMLDDMASGQEKTAWMLRAFLAG